MKKVLIGIPEGLHKQAVKYAKDKHMTLTALINLLLTLVVEGKAQVVLAQQKPNAVIKDEDDWDDEDGNWKDSPEETL
jgi:hypothetical protein